MSSAGISMNKQMKAFTLIELLIAMSIVFIIASMSLPRLNIQTRRALLFELNSLSLIISLLQQKALASNQSQQIIIDTNTHSYTFPGKTKGRSYTLTQPLLFGFIDTIKGPPASPKRFITQSITFQQDYTNLMHHSKVAKGGPEGIFTITCAADGKLPSGSIYVIDQKKTIMGAVTVGIGEINALRIYLHENNHWEAII